MIINSKGQGNILCLRVVMESDLPEKKKFMFWTLHQKKYKENIHICKIKNIPLYQKQSQSKHHQNIHKSHNNH